MTAQTEVIDADTVAHFDMYSAEQEKQRHAILAYARTHCPVAHTDADGGGQYIVSSYDLVRTILEDPVTFSSTGVAPRPSPVSMNPLDVDPPYHSDLRKLLNPLFSRTFLLKFEPALRAQAAALIDTWVADGRVELISQFAAPFVGAALADIVFGEQDPAKMQSAIDIVTAVAIEASDSSFAALGALAGQYVADRDANPVDRDDVLNAISRGTVGNGRPLTLAERMGVITVLFLGGLDTTRGAIGSIAYHVANDPTLEARIRDPKWIRRDMDEFLRLDSPVACLGRRAMTDVELGGVLIKQGEQVLLRYDSANLDAAKFDNPAELDFDTTRSGHAAFGLGIHRCLGAHLARIQIAVAFDELFKRVTNLTLVGPADSVHWAPGSANGPESLTLTFDRI